MALITEHYQTSVLHNTVLGTTTHMYFVPVDQQLTQHCNQTHKEPQVYLHLHVERNSQNLKFLNLKVNSDGGLVVPLEDIPTIPAGGEREEGEGGDGPW